MGFQKTSEAGEVDYSVIGPFATCPPGYDRDPVAEYERADFLGGTYATLGRKAVYVSLINTEYTLRHNTKGTAGTSMIVGKIEKARAELESIPNNSVEEMDDALRLWGMPPWLSQQVGLEHTGPEEARMRLLEADESGNYKVPAETFLNVLQWHNYRMAGEQAYTESLGWRNAKTWFVNQLKRAVAEGWLPQQSLSGYRRQLIDNTALRVDDGMGTLAVSSMGSSNVMDDHNIFITLPPPWWKEHVLIPQVVTHEFVHIIDGKDASRLVRRLTDSPVHRSGLHRLFGRHEKAAGTVLNEAIVEHITQTLLTGGPEIINPIAKEGSYEIYRRFLEILCKGGEKSIDIRLFVDAYFEDTRILSGRRNSALLELRKQLKQAFPDHKVLKDLAKMARSSTDKKKPDEELIHEYALKLREHYMAKRVARHTQAA